ncbi:hypothetical protein [Fontibacillus sp. BL9]|uniref:hypothetical protein n=1 Tax=Fontibacillus sp. BL9 TaxID=3389971 RepID=UPI00397B8B94
MQFYSKVELGEKLNRLSKFIEKYAESKDEKILIECKDLQKQFVVLGESDAEGAIDLNHKIIILEKRSSSLISKRSLYTYLLLSILVVLYAVLYSLINSTDIRVFLSILLISIIGAFTYFVTEQLNKSKNYNIILKLTSAVVMAFMISTVFTKDGKTLEVSQPQLLFFMIGFSSELMIELLNKLIEKAKKILE